MPAVGRREARRDDPKPFVWTATADSILDKVRRDESPSITSYNRDRH